MADETDELLRRVREHLEFIYPPEVCDRVTRALLETMGLVESCAVPMRYQNHWDQSDSVLITYGDSIVNNVDSPLHTLYSFLKAHLQGTISAVHILPFFPFSSDDGFSVIDYLKVNESLGNWEDISAIAADFDLMADLVINHVSSRSRWFENFKKRVDPGKDFFVEASPEDDLSEVVRPRSSPLLHEVETLDGKRHVWCTFSADQVDLNFSNPEVLIEFIQIIRHYLERGVKLFRLDAVAFLWKQAGSSCIHLQQTHEIIKLLRTLIEHHSPGAVIITETNVPNRENLTYFGNANEAHVIYNFSLPPLLIHTLVSGDCRHLKTWMMSMPPARNGTAYLNFIASHDGIGLRPLDGLLADDEREQLLDAMKDFGAKLTVRRSREGNEKPYEINIALFDALKGTVSGGPDAWQTQRFLCAHVIMLALEGIPALYIHSLFGTRNDYDRVKHTGRNRSINRHIWQLNALEDVLADPSQAHYHVFREMVRLLRIRRHQPAFHPNATQFTLHLGTPIFAFWRQSIDREQSIFSISNVTDRAQTINLADINLIGTDHWVDLISENPVDDLAAQLTLSPYQSLWLTNLADVAGSRTPTRSA